MTIQQALEKMKIESEKSQAILEAQRIAFLIKIEKLRRQNTYVYHRDIK